jgi:hypothetical protein
MLKKKSKITFFEWVIALKLLIFANYNLYEKTQF